MYQNITSYSRSTSQAKEKDAVFPPGSKKQVYFPQNPYDFAPKGLIRCEYPGTDNGRIFKWKDPVSGNTIFEWDEDFLMGEHYHVLLVEWDEKHLDPTHYAPNTAVPEPWNSWYF